jgi:diacylglycerol kinase
MLCALLVIGLGWFFRITGMEWIIVCLCIASVLITELINTAIEELCNKIQTEFDKDIGRIKDIAAGAVFLAAVLSTIVGLILFLPKILDLF